MKAFQEGVLPRSNWRYGEGWSKTQNAKERGRIEGLMEDGGDQRNEDISKQGIDKQSSCVENTQ